MTKTVLTGGCQCGAVRYDITAEPVALFVCHCRECQKQSASAFGISVIVPTHAFRVRHGTVRVWPRRTDSGRTLHCTFCAECGTRISHATSGEDTVSVKGGSLDQPVDLSPAVHIWTASRLSGVIIPEGARHYPREPE